MKLSETHAAKIINRVEDWVKTRNQHENLQEHHHNPASSFISHNFSFPTSPGLTLPYLEQDHSHGKQRAKFKYNLYAKKKTL